MNSNYNAILSTIFVITLFCYACGDSNSQKKIEKIDITRVFTLDTALSDISWERYLEKGPSTKQMKLFGNPVEITIDGSSVEYSGKIESVQGKLNKLNDSIENAAMEFDFTKIVLNTNHEKKGDDLILVEKVKESQFVIHNFEKDTAGYLLNSELSMAGETKPVVAFANIKEDNDSLITLKTEFELNSLDWPLWDHKDREVIVNDVITVAMNLCFKIDEVKLDTVFVE